MTVKRVFHIMMGTDGGTERFFLRLSQEFAARGIEQQFALRPDMPWMAEVAKMGPVHAGHHLRRWPMPALKAKAMQRRMRAWEPDVVMAWRAPAARLIPAAGDFVKFVRLGDYPRHLRHFGALDTIVANAPSVERHCRDLGWTGEIDLISNFPSDRTVTPVDRASLSTPFGVPLVVATGRFFATKGFDTLLRAIARTDNLWLWLVGDGEQKDMLQALSRDLGIRDRVRMPGWVSNPQDYIAAGDVFCVPSREEPLGNVFFEGWQTGVPVVSTRSEGPSWAATHGEDAVLVDIDDEAALAEAMTALATDRDLAARLVAAARQTLVQRFSKTAIVDQYLALFDRIAAEKPSV